MISLITNGTLIKRSVSIWLCDEVLIKSFVKSISLKQLIVCSSIEITKYTKYPIILIYNSQKFTMNINNRSKYRQFSIIMRYFIKFTKFDEISQKFSIRKCDNGQRWVKSRYTIVDRKWIFTVVRGKWHVSRERNKFQLLEIERKIPGWKRLIESGKLIRAKSITIRVCHAWMSNGRIHRFLLTHANNILGGETFYLYDTDIQITIETRLISRARLSSIRNNFPSSNFPVY